MHRDKVIKKIEEYFGPDMLAMARKTDTMLANGIQIHGKDEVKTIVVGVSATMALFREAAKHNADMILCKHPLYLTAPYQLIDQSLQARLRAVFHYDWTVGGYHHILDVHPEIGNVPLLMAKLGVQPLGQFYDGWGYYAEFPKPVALKHIGHVLEQTLQHDVCSIVGEKTHVQRIGIVSGSAIPKKEKIIELQELGIELYITGEITEWAVHLFRELGIAYFAVGHHAMEVLGPQAFAHKLTTLLDDKVKVEFVNVWNEV